MDKIEKSLRKLSFKERQRAEEIVARLIVGQWQGLEIIPLKGSRGIFRVRFGSCRIIFSLLNKEVNILFVGRRNEKTYKNF